MLDCDWSSDVCSSDLSMARTLEDEALLQLVDALASGEWTSGEQLAATVGLTRAGLSKRVAHLRAWGLVVESRFGRGYRLARPLERLDEERLRAATPPDLRLNVMPLVDSTNRALMDADPAEDPQALLAEFQSAGRGRRGREWRSPFGANLYLSISWTYPLWPQQLPALSLAVGVVCARALHAAGLDGLRLKWPNDLWVGKRKIGGILIEQRGESIGTCRVIVGVGINVSMSRRQGEDIDQPWISLDEALSEAGRPRVSRTDLAASLVHGLHECLGRYQVTGFDAYREEWLALDALRDREVHVPGEKLRGLGRGLDPHGAFLIETREGQLQRVLAGDVSLRPV
jgi:BirA family biotin operon repressor/biotin-[acetyl-CoA-carboxylase] ligase